MSFHIPSSLLILICLSSALLSAGCSNSLAVVSAKGTVTFKGEPVAEAEVTMISVEGGRWAVAATNADGEFEVVTPGAKKGGCLPGKYKVGIIKTIMIDRNGKTIVIVPEMLGDDATIPFPTNFTEKNILPEKYANAETSGFEIEVERWGTNEFTFELVEEVTK